MGKKEELVYEFADGHRILRDRYAWILHHAKGCRNTEMPSYFVTPMGLQEEIRRCGLARQIPRSIRERVGFSILAPKSGT